MRFIIVLILSCIIRLVCNECSTLGFLRLVIHWDTCWVSETIQSTLSIGIDNLYESNMTKQLYKATAPELQ